MSGRGRGCRRGPRRWRRALLGAALLALVVTACAPQGEWPTSDGDAARTGIDLSDNLNPLSPAWTNGLDGAAVYGQPLVADGRVFVATEDDDVYALDAHDGHVLWQYRIGNPLTNVAAAVGCGDIDPLGVTSAPVIDTATGTLYVVGEVSNGGSPPTVSHQLVGLDLTTGKVVRTADADPPLPAGESPLDLLQRASLALANGRVYVGFGGQFGDCGHYHGWLVGIGESSSTAAVSFEAAPDGEGGAVWEPGGPAVNGPGDIYLTTGNANPDPPQGGPDPKLYTESAVMLGPNLGTPLASYKDTIAGGDEDLSTDSPTVLLDGDVFVVGKTDVGYVLNATNLQLVAAIHGVCGSNPDGANAVDLGLDSLYVPCRGGGLQEVNLANNTLGWHAGDVNGSPILVGGQLWALQYPSGTLEQLAPATGAVLQRLSVGAVPTFASPSAALGLLLVGTTHGVVAYQGPGGAPPPAPPAQSVKTTGS